MVTKAITKELTLSLFTFTEIQDDAVITDEIISILKDRDTVEQRIVDLEDDKGSACAMDVVVKEDIVLLHLARFEKGAPVDVIRHTSNNLKQSSLDVEVVPPEEDSDYLKCQAVALFRGNAAIAMVSDGREYSLVWSFVHKLLGKAKFIPRQVFSTEIKEAIEKHGIKSIRLNGFVAPTSVKEALRCNNMNLLEYRPPEEEKQKRNESVKVSLTFTPERNAVDYVANLMSSVFDKSSGTIIDSDDGLFSLLVTTKQKENIRKEGFCRSKKVKFQKYGSFVFKTEAYKELLGWFKELRAAHEWPS